MTSSKKTKNSFATVRHVYLPHNCTSENVTAKTARKMFVLKMIKPPNVERNLVEQNLSTKAVYELPFKVTMDNKLKCFQYKVVHNILPTNSNLYKIS